MELKCLSTSNFVPLENIAILNCSSAIQIINTTSTCYRHEEEYKDTSLSFLNSVKEDVGNLDVYLDIPDINDFRKYVIGYIAAGVAHYLSKKN